MRRLIECFLYGSKLVRVPDPNRVRKFAPPLPRKAYFHCFGVLFNPKAFWVGAHYGSKDKRLCLNLLPFVTLWGLSPEVHCREQ